MDDLIRPSFHSDTDSETDEALSFCDLPIKKEADPEIDNSCKASKRYELEEFFEFANIRNPEPVRSAEDIIASGKLLPYKSLPIVDQSQITFQKSRSDSVLQRSQSCAKSRFQRSNRSLDYSKLQRASSNSKSMRERGEISSAPPSTGRSSSVKKTEFSLRRDAGSTPPVKPRWPFMMFGLMKAPPEMELKDIRNRQTRRIPSSMFPSCNGMQTVSVKRDGEKGPWRFFRALSCKDHADVVVTASFGCVPNV